jgi:hypothetical protein
MPMNFAMLSTDSSSPMQPLTLCSEDDDELSNIPLGSNLWESIFINSNHNNEMENMVTISTKFDSNLPKNANLLCLCKLPRKDCFRFTQGERFRGENAIEPSSLEEMTIIVSANNQ